MPELFKGAEPSELTDVFSVGALLYQAVIGTTLEGRTDVSLVAEQYPHFDQLLRRCTAKDPKARPQSANQLRMLCREAVAAMEG